MLYPFEWQKLTNSCGKLFARANLAALLCQSKDKKKGGPENLERPWFGDLGQSVASEGTVRVWGRHGMHWHLFSTGGCVYVLRCQLSRCVVFTDKRTAQGGENIDLSFHSCTLPSCNTAWRCPRLRLHLKRRLTGLRDLCLGLQLWFWSQVLLGMRD